MSCIEFCSVLFGVFNLYEENMDLCNFCFYFFVCFLFLFTHCVSVLNVHEQCVNFGQEELKKSACVIFF